MTPGVTVLSSAPQGDGREMENGEVTRRCTDYGGKKKAPPKKLHGRYFKGSKNNFVKRWVVVKETRDLHWDIL